MTYRTHRSFRRLALAATVTAVLVAMAVVSGCSSAPTQSAQQAAPAQSSTTASSAAQPTTSSAAATSTATGGKLQIKDLKVGKGATAKTGDSVTVNYTGWLMDGTKFDSSIGKAPFPFVLGAGRVIPGWDQGVVGMKVGGTRELIIPPSLGYGSQGAGGVIPPDATLKFDVELLSIANAPK